MQSSTGEMAVGKDANGETIFYATGINARNMDSLDGVDVLASARRTLSVPIRYGILQRVRSGVLIETYLLSGVMNAALPGTLHAINRTEAANTQRVFLQMPLTQSEQKLTTDDRDLAVAVTRVRAAICCRPGAGRQGVDRVARSERRDAGKNAVQGHGKRLGRSVYHGAGDCSGRGFFLQRH